MKYLLLFPSRIYILFCLLLFLAKGYAQLPNISRGHLSGSFESYSQFYQPDKKINAILPQDRVGSNNYLKLDYNYNRIAIGIQYESYLPTVAGFPFTLNQSKIINRYFRYTANKFIIQAGDFYEQFGSGLILRSWENRQIGINNALEGVKLHFNPLPYLNLKAVYGKQRKVFDHANSVVRGLDAEIDFSRLRSNTDVNTRITAGLSYVSRYQQYTGPDPSFPATVSAYGSRVDISGQSASLSVEYVYKTKDPTPVNGQDKTGGNALLVNASVTGKNLGLNLSLRSLENFDYRGERDAIGTQLPVNFVPALTKQHDYLTTNIYVYNAQTAGEAGGQVDLFYNIKGKRNRTSRIAVNFSQYRALRNKNDIFSISDNRYFSDFSFEWKKKWSTAWNTTLAYHNVYYNKSVVEGGIYDNISANILLLNTLYKYAKNKSFRFELQNLFTKQDNRNWAAAVAEFGFAPALNIYVNDLYNYGVTNVHYTGVGGSYAKGGTRFAIGYGRQRAGLICVGGVCRFVPAATGITATLTTTFNN